MFSSFVCFSFSSSFSCNFSMPVEIIELFWNFPCFLLSSLTIQFFSKITHFFLIWERALHHQSNIHDLSFVSFHRYKKHNLITLSYPFGLLHSTSTYLVFCWSLYGHKMFQNLSWGGMSKVIYTIQSFYRMKTEIISKSNQLNLVQDIYLALACQRQLHHWEIPTLKLRCRRHCTTEEPHLQHVFDPCVIMDDN